MSGEVTVCFEREFSGWASLFFEYFGAERVFLCCQGQSF
jgi:hypothetical protein